MEILTVSRYFKEKYNKKLVKIAINAGFNCPGKCTYCSNMGSVAPYQYKNISSDRYASIQKQIVSRYSNYKVSKRDEILFYLYLQAFSNTYASIEELKYVYDYSLHCSKFHGFIIGTRPDLINYDISQLLASYNETYDTWVELGLQTDCDEILSKIGRNHTYKQFEDAVLELNKARIKVTVHIIVGLYNKSIAKHIDLVKKLSDLPIHGIKFHYLYIMKNTKIVEAYERGEIDVLSSSEYLEILIEMLKNLRKDIVVFRLFSDSEPATIAPIWDTPKEKLIKYLEHV